MPLQVEWIQDSKFKIVQGIVTLRNGAADIRLAPVVQPPTSRAARPTMDEVQTWEIHESRLPFSKDQLASAMIVVQKQLSLPVGILQGDWTEVATKRLKDNLAKPKKGATKRSSSVLGEQEQQRVLALEDKKDEEEALKKKKRKAPAEEKDVEKELAEDSAVEKESPTNGSSESDSDPSSSSSSSTTQSHLRAEIGILSEAISCHQRIEEDNAQLTQKIGVLTEENLRLHARLRAALSWHGRLWRQLAR